MKLEKRLFNFRVETWTSFVQKRWILLVRVVGDPVWLEKLSSLEFHVSSLCIVGLYIKSLVWPLDTTSWLGMLKVTVCLAAATVCGTGRWGGSRGCGRGGVRSRY